MLARWRHALCHGIGKIRQAPARQPLRSLLTRITFWSLLTLWAGQTNWPRRASGTRITLWSLLTLSAGQSSWPALLAGQPTNLSVVALRREEIEEEPIEAPALSEPLEGEAVPAAPEVAAAPLDPVVAGAAAAIETASLEAPAAAPKPPAAPKPAAAKLAKPYIQIGIFSVETNARNTATAMRQAGMVPTVRKQSSNGKTFWRVVVGPATNKSELDALLKKIKATGFSDAYAVTN